MAGAFLTIELDDAAAQAAFERILSFADGERSRLMMGDIGEAMKTNTQLRAATERSPDGTPWARLSPKYAKRKAAKRPGVPMLRWDNHMLGDMFSWQLDPQDGAAVVGTNALWGATHQFGDPERNIPARPWLGLSDEDQTEIMDIILEHGRMALEGDAP